MYRTLRVEHMPQAYIRLAYPLVCHASRALGIHSRTGQASTITLAVAAWRTTDVTDEGINRQNSFVLGRTPKKPLGSTVIVEEVRRNPAKVPSTPELNAALRTHESHICIGSVIQFRTPNEKPFNAFLYPNDRM
jgi:hypothetical protein